MMNPNDFKTMLVGSCLVILPFIWHGISENRSHFESGPMKPAEIAIHSQLFFFHPKGPTCCERCQAQRITFDQSSPNGRKLPEAPATSGELIQLEGFCQVIHGQSNQLRVLRSHLCKGLRLDPIARTMSLALGGLPSMLPQEKLAELKETAAKLCAPGTW